MRREKQFLLDEIKEQLEGSSTFLLTRYQGMDPNLTYNFRLSISETGGFYKVVKKRVFLKAADEIGLAVDRENLDGHIGIIYAGEDTVATTKVIYKFTSDNTGLMEVIGGLFEGKQCSPQDFKEISKLPSQEQMRAEFLGILQAPMSAIVGTMEALLGGTTSCIDQKAQKES
ncbi:MAG: 50S ribosomal protein L10 [Chlamydiae bacterium]|nr:50S ribosomal protein L10 [Chlamydiota bacterium]